MTHIQDVFHAGEGQICSSNAAYFCVIGAGPPCMEKTEPACRKIKRHLESITVMAPLLARSSDLAWSIVKEAGVYVG